MVPIKQPELPCFENSNHCAMNCILNKSNKAFLQASQKPKHGIIGNADNKPYRIQQKKVQ